MKKKNDPINGQFAKGNPGRVKGSKNLRTLQWEELGKEITDGNTGRFNDLLSRLWDSPDVSDQLRAADLFLKVAEFFKPKLQRIHLQPGASEPQPITGMRIVLQSPSVDADGNPCEVETPLPPSGPSVVIGRSTA